MIAFRCSGCGKPLSVKEELAGQRSVCPACKQAVLVPHPEQTALVPAGAKRAGKVETQVQRAADMMASMEAVEAAGSKLDFLAPAQRRDELGRLGPYRVLKVLGAGAMGLVLQAEDPQLKRRVALKVMRPELAAQPTNRQRFLREAQATAAVEHPHIVHIHQVGEDRGIPYLAMSFLQGETLDARMKREGKLPVADAVRIARQTAQGLAAAHECGLIHRDIKPANLWLEEKTGCVKILDFGLARTDGVDLQLTQAGTILGTPAYMSPEQARNKPVDGRSDLFSLGLILYRLLSGQPAFQGNDMMAVLVAISTDTPRPVQKLNPAVPPALAALVMQLLEKDPALRPTSAQAVADALARFEEDRTQVLPSSPGPRVPNGLAPRTASSAKPLARPSPPRRRGLLLALAAGLLLAGVAVFWVLRKGDTETVASPDHSTQLASVLATTTGGPTSRPRVPATAPAEPGNDITNTIGMKLIYIRPGKFKMGSPPEEPGRCSRLARGEDDEQLHDVELTQPFYMASRKVTVREFRAFVTETKYKTEAEMYGGASLLLPGGWKRDPKHGWHNVNFEQKDDHPVVCVTYNDAIQFCEWLTKKEGQKYVLPTEAQWEYSCRAGTQTAYSFGTEPAELYAWYSPKAENRTHPVGEKRPNVWGLFDMNGNVWEWTADYYDKDYYKRSPVKDPPGPVTGIGHALRGGAWHYEVRYCRAAQRRGFGNTPGNDRWSDVGFRVARAVP